MTLTYPNQPLHILLFDNTGIYHQPLTRSLSAHELAVNDEVACESVDTLLAFQRGLTSDWDAILVAYPVAADALAVMRRHVPERSCILLHTPAEEEQAFALRDERISDLVPLDGMRRLPLSLRHEWRLKQCQESKLQLQRMEMRFRSIIEGFDDTILIIDSERAIRYANSAFQRIFGYDIIATLGQPLVPFFHPTEEAALQECLSHLCRSVGTVRRMEHRLQRANGAWAHVETAVHSLHDPAGEVIIVFHVRDVSVRKQAEEELIESKQRLQFFAQHAPAAIALLDREMKYLSVSRRWLSDYRLGEVDIIGRSHYEVFPDLPEHWREIHQRCLQGEVETSDADPFPRADGTLDWVRWEVRPWHNSLGEIEGIILFSEVITKRRQAELALQEREQQLNQAQAIAHLGSWMVHLPTSVLTWSEEIFRICGLEPGTVEPSIELGLSLVHPDERDRVMQAWETSQRTGTPYHIEQRIVRPNGEIRWVDSQGEAMVGEDGRPLMLVGTIFDITERKVTQESLEQRVAARTAELQLAKERVEAILNHSPDGILLIRPDLSIQQTNIAFRRLFGYGPEEQLNTSLSRLVYEPDAGVISGLTTTVTGEQVEIRAIRKDGLVFDVELSVSAINGDGFVCVIRDITERKSQERLLRFQASMQETVSDAVIVMDREFHIHSWNKAAERIYGWCAEEVINKSVIEVLRTQFLSAEESERRIRQLREQGWWQGEVIHTHKNGSLCHILGSVTAIKEAGGVTIGVVAVNHDITEWKQAEQALQKSAAEIHDLYHNAPCGYHSLDKDGVFIQINDTELRWLGYKREEVIGKLKFAELLTAESKVTFQANFPLFKTRGSVSNLEFEFIRRDGSILPILLSSTAIYDQNGDYLQSRSMIFDITALQHARQAIAESEARYRLLAENVTDMITKVDTRGVRTFVTPSCYPLLGYTPDELTGEPIFEIIHPDDRLKTHRTIMKAVSAERPSFTLSQRLCHKDGHYLWVEVIGTTLRDAQSGTVTEIVAVIRNITERKAQERQLRYHAGLQSTVSDAVIVTDMEMHIQSWNKAAERIYGWHADEVIGKSIIDIIRPQFSSPAEHARQRQQLHELGWWQGEITERHKDGSLLYILASFTLVEDDDGFVYGIVAVNHDITERKEMENALRESEARYRLLAETEFDMVSRNNLQGDFIYVSPSAERLLGYHPDELIGRPGFVVVHPEQHAQMAEALHHTSQTRKQPSPQVFQMRHKEGHYLLLELSIRAILSEETGEVVEFISSARDITERVQAEEALRASEEKFRQVAENFDQLLFIRSADNRQMLFINSASEKITGISREQMYADPQTFLKHVHPEDLDYVRQQQTSQRYLEKGICDLEYRLIRVGGQIRWIRVRTFPIKNEQGEIFSRVGIIEDITERKEAELALQESEARYRLLVETMHGGLVVFDTDDRMTYVTDRFCELLGYSREELIGTRSFDYMDGVNATKVKEQLGRRRQLENSSYEVEFRRPDGKLLHLLSLGSPLRDKAGSYNGGFAVVTDITAQKQAESTLRQALAHEQELGELKSRFVSIASHEFRTPLATISATAETLIAYRGRLDAGQLDARLHKILSQVGHMKSIMEDVLQLARIQAGRMEFTPEFGDLSALCCNVIEEFQSHPDYQQRIKYDSGAPPVQFPFDVRLMRHILNNLLANGLKYSPNKQPITVRLHQDMKTVTLQVLDRGIGIPEKDLKHLFEPFHRAKNVGTISGTGLGLCITKEAVELHGGTIHIDTEIDVGTTVTVTIPSTTLSNVTFPTDVERREIHGDHFND